jgi:hypothetical protein
LNIQQKLIRGRVARERIATAQRLIIAGAMNLILEGKRISQKTVWSFRLFVRNNST